MNRRSRIMPALFRLLVFLLPFQASSFASTIHVPADKPTIQAAINAAVDGDVILVAPGTYLENIDFSTKAITVQSAGGASVTIIDGQNLSTVVTFGDATGGKPTLRGFTIQHGAATSGAGLFLLGASPAILDNIFLSNAQANGGFGAAIGVNNGSPDIERNLFMGNTCDGQALSGVVSFVNTASPFVANNIFWNNPCRAIDITIPQDNSPVIINNTIVGNPVGIHVDARIPTVLQSYENNLIAGNTVGLEVVFLNPGNEPTWKNNLVFGNGTDYSGISSLTGSAGNISVDPQFVNQSSGNFHLQATSPAVEAGTNSAPRLPSQDFEKNDRVLDGRGTCSATVDIGAYEFARASSLSFNPASLLFADQIVGTASASLPSTITNNSSSAAKVCAINVAGDYSETTSCGNSIPAGASCPLNVTFTPAARGIRDGLLQIITADAGSPQTIALSGKGIAPLVTLSAPTLNFSSQLVGTTSVAQTITLSNSGDAPLSISRIAAAGDFAETDNCPASLAVSAGCTINITFTPTAFGTRGGTLTITDGAQGSPHNVNLIGDASDFSLSAINGRSLSATVAAGVSANYQLQVAPQNGFTGSVSISCTGAPSLAVCSASPQSVNITVAQVPFTVSVTTTAATAASPIDLPRFSTPRFVPLFLLTLSIFLLAAACLANSRTPLRRRVLVATSFAIVLSSWATSVGCGGGYSGNPGTPKETYQLKVTGTSSGQSRQLTLTLTVN